MNDPAPPDDDFVAGDLITGPFEVLELEPISAPRHRTQVGAYAEDTDFEEAFLEPPKRNYGCPHYDSCLNLAAALNWASFGCGDCCGKINPKLYWRAHQSLRKDKIAQALCELPPIEVACTKVDPKGK